VTAAAVPREDQTAAAAQSRRPMARGARLGPVIVAASAAVLLLVGALFLVIALEQRSMEQVAEDSKDRVAPLILERQRAAVNLERFKRYGAVVIASDDAWQRRQALLAAQALAFHPGFHFDSALRLQVSEAFDVLRQASTLKDEAERRRQEAVAAVTPTAATSARQEATDLNRKAANTWHEMLVALDATADRLSVDVASLTAGRFAAIQDTAQWVSSVVLAGFIGMLALLGATVWMARRHVVRPVLLAADALERIGAGAHDVHLPPASTSEMDTIFRSVERLDHLVDDLRTAQSHLVQAEKMVALGSLVAGVAHEINSPLGVAVTASSLLADRTNELSKSFKDGQMRRADFEEYLATATEVTQSVQANLDRAAKLVHSFKQVAVDQASEDHRRFPLGPYLEEVMQSLSVSLRKAGLKASVECPDDLDVEGYPGALGQLLTNLAMNSMLHGYEPGQSGKLTVKVRRRGSEQVELRFSDDGRGIPPDLQTRVFEPFFTTRRGAGSTGLGLHIVFNLVTQRLKGRIAIDSAPGKGTTFIIRFPRAVPRE